uniref:Endonuclease/exonuclease/phosphatase domain-containing protein n=1 Tax=Arion vulgaris TaxID=1028688 RepID=A0A0B7BVU2_9EUPU
MYNNNRNSSEIGRRLEYQGPRQTEGNRAVLCEKLTTGKNKTNKCKHRNTQNPWRKKDLQMSDDQKNKHSLNILQLNICGLRNKKIELSKLLHDHKVHVALLQETLHKDSDLHLTGYTSYPCRCTDCRGIVTYIRNDIQGDASQLTTAHPTDVQQITIWHSGGKYTIYNIYNPPQKTLKLPELHNTQYRKTILAGDLNGHSPRWGYPDNNRTGKLIEELCDTTNLSVLQNAESPPTLLHRAHLSLTRPDLTICSSDLTESCHSQILDDIGSDHKPLLTTITTVSRACRKQKHGGTSKKLTGDFFKKQLTLCFHKLKPAVLRLSTKK